MNFRRSRITSRIVALFLLVIGLNACQFDTSNDIPDVSGIEIDVKIRRFEERLFNLDTTQLSGSLQQLATDYPTFSKLFFDYVLQSGNPQVAPEGHEAYIKGFVSFPFVRNLYDTCRIVFPDLTVEEQKFKQAFQYLKYYFPEVATPTVTSFISEFSIGSFIYEGNGLATGLDFFLGADYPYSKYNPQNPNFSGYLTRTFNKDHLVAKTLHPLVEDLLGAMKGDRMIDHLIYEGKKLYLLDLLLPFEPDSILLEMTGTQVDWLNQNEKEIWSFFLQENLLYSTDWRAFRKYVEYSPHSPDMPPEAPGRTGSWIGWQVMKAYAKRYPDANIEAILKEPAQFILDKSRYKPKR